MCRLRLYVKLLLFTFLLPAKRKIIAAIHLTLHVSCIYVAPVNKKLNVALSITTGNSCLFICFLQFYLNKNQSKT